MAKYNMAQVINAISSCMSCQVCPYPCKAKMPSKSACNTRWYKVLSEMDRSKGKQEIYDELFAIFSGKIPQRRGRYKERSQHHNGKQIKAETGHSGTDAVSAD